MEHVEGVPYSEHLTNLLKSKQITDKDRDKTKFISDYLVKLHESSKLDRLTYIRETCNFIMHNLTKLDGFNSDLAFREKYGEEIKEVTNSLEVLLTKSVNKSKVCLVHNDLHPTNILFRPDDSFRVIDPIGNMYGEQSADIATISLFYIWYGLRDSNSSEIFLQLYESFMENYLNDTNNLEIMEILPTFYTVRALRLAYFNESVNQDPWTNKPLLELFCQAMHKGRITFDEVRKLLKK